MRALTEIGRKQAEVLAGFLSDYPIDRIVSSSYTRAQQSIEPFAAKVGLPIHLDHRLIERTLSGSPIDNWREVVRDSFGDMELRVPGGESAREVLDRGWAAITELLDGGHRVPNCDNPWQPLESDPELTGPYFRLRWMGSAIKARRIRTQRSRRWADWYSRGSGLSSPEPLNNAVRAQWEQK